MPAPIVQTLLACDRIARNRADGRCDLFGVFPTLNVTLPTHITFGVYYVLTGCHWRTELGIHFLAPDDTVLAGGVVIVPSDDPLAVVQGTAAFDGVKIADAGTYRLQLTHAGEVLAERPIIIGVGS